MRVYLELLRLRGSAWFTLAGFVGRFPIGMRSVGCVLLVVGVTGSYSLAGTVAAVLVLCQAAAAPVVGRLTDAYGQSAVVWPSVALNAVGTVGLVFVAGPGPVWALYGFSVLAGATVVPIGSLVRARWSSITGGTQRSSAYAFEGALDEAIFVLGPIVTTLLVVQVTPGAGLLCAAALYVAGAVWLGAQRGTEPSPVAPARDSGAERVLRPWMLALLAAYALVGVFFGAFDVALIAFASERNALDVAGLLLGLLATGSLVSGIVYGVVQWRIEPSRRLLYATLWLAACTIPLCFVSSVVAVAGLTVVAGLGVAPILISANSLVERTLPESVLAQGLTWLSSAVTLGMSAGPAIAGAVVDRSGSRAALVLSSGCVVLSLLITAAGSRSFARAESTAEPADQH